MQFEDENADSALEREDNELTYFDNRNIVSRDTEPSAFESEDPVPTYYDYDDDTGPSSSIAELSNIDRNNEPMRLDLEST